MLQIRCYEWWDMSFAAEWIWDLLNMIQLFTSSYEAWKMMAFDTLLLFSHSVMSDSWNLPCPSPSPGNCSNSYPLSKWCHPTISSSVTRLLLLPSIFPSIRVFSNESALHIRWPKNWIFSFSINPSNEYSGLISFRIDWFSILAAQGTLRSLL